MRTARDYSVPLSFLRGAKRLRWSVVDRLLAVALTIYEAGICSGCGQSLRESTDPELEDKWTTDLPHRCHACTAIARRAKEYDDQDFPQAYRFVVGLRGAKGVAGQSQTV